MLSDSDFDYKVGKNIQKWRRRRRYTQTVLATMIGCTTQTVGKYESGDISMPGHRLLKLAVALEVPLSALVAGVSPEYDAIDLERVAQAA